MLLTGLYLYNSYKMLSGFVYVCAYAHTCRMPLWYIGQCTIKVLGALQNFGEQSQKGPLKRTMLSVDVAISTKM